MEYDRKSDLLSYQNKTFDELYVINTLIQMTKSSCTEREFKGQYYGCSTKIKKCLSAERNQYITMLTLAADRLATLMNINLSMEDKISSQLQNYTNNSCRKVTTECSAD